MKFFLVFLFAGLLIFAGCGSKKDPGQKPLAVVSSDTLKALDVERLTAQYLRFHPMDSQSVPKTAMDALRNLLIQNWVDRKLALRQARNDRFNFDETKTDSLYAFGARADSGAMIGKDLAMLPFYLIKIKKENPVTTWDIRQMAREVDTVKSGATSLDIQYFLEEKKLLDWINGLRPQGGFLMLDASIPSKHERPKPEFPAIDTAGGSIGAILKKLFPEEDPRSLEAVALYALALSTEKVDVSVFKQISKVLEKRVPKETVKPESRAHLYRNAESIQKVISKYLPELRENYKKGLKRNPSLEGRIIVRMVISEEGAVAEAGIAGSQISDRLYIQKLCDEIRTWKFPPIPKGAGEMIVNYPFDFDVTE